MNWGKGIIAGLSIFVVFIVAMCIYMISSPADSFDHQYYERGLNFDHDYDREKQVVKDRAQPSITVENERIEFRFVNAAKGTVKFMRPSSSALDKVYTFESSSGQQSNISLAPFAAGKWQLVLEWESNNKSYLYQQEIFLK
jgi:hypothetical protein